MTPSPPPPVPNPAGQPMGGAVPQRSGLALASLILGLVGIFLCLGPLAGIPAVICGHKAHSKIRRSGGTMEGLGLATAGLVTGYISIAMVVIIALLAAIAVPNFIRAREHAMANACRNNMRSIAAAKSIWALEQKKPEGAVPADDDLFGPDKSMPQKPLCLAGGVYSLNAASQPPSCSKHGSLAEAGF